MDTIPSDKLPEWLVEKSESRESEAKPVRIIAGKSLGVFSVTNPIRVLCTTVVWHKQFKTIMLILISLNVLALGLEAPWNDSYPTLKDVLNALEIVFVIVFTIEAAMKIIATGLYKDSLPASYRPDEGMTEDVRPYLVSKWNRIDFTVVAMSWLGLFIPFFTLLRCARSLRILIRNRNVKVVVSALFQALPAMGNVVLVVGFVFVIFGVLGVQLFKGAFYSCNAPDILLKSECNGTGPVPSGMDVFGDIVYLEREREWVNKPFHFDNIGSALLALLEMGIGDGWANIMFAGIDSKSHEEAPERDSNPVNAIYFVLFVASGSFFAINLFIGLLIDRFNELKGELDGSAFLTEDQQAWLRYNRVIGRLQLVRVPDLDTWLKRKLSQLVFSKQFETMIILCIVVNVAFMGARHYNQTDEETLMQYVANTVFAGLFAIEAALKIFVMRKLYFTDSWNKFDFSLVLLSFVGFFLGNSNIQVLRILRICRVMRLIKKAQGLEKLFGTLFFSLPSFMNISLLLLVVYYNFGVVGVQAFGRVGKGLGITKWTNFENLGNAIMTLYIMSTTENWAVIMRDAAASNPGCEENNSCGSLWAYLYFPCFTVLGGMIVLNLVITVVLENFGEQESLSVKAPSLNLVSDLRVSWAKYDPQLTGKITVSDFLEILDMLPQPLGFASGGDRDWTLKFYILKKLHVPVIDEYVFYQDILNAYIGTIFNISREGLEALQNYAAIHGTMGTQYMLYDVFAVYTIQRAWRNRLRMRGCTKKRVAPPDNPLTEKPEEEEEEEEYEFKEDQRAHPLAVPTE